MLRITGLSSLSFVIAFMSVSSISRAAIDLSETTIVSSIKYDNENGYLFQLGNVPTSGTTFDSPGIIEGVISGPAGVANFYGGITAVGGSGTSLLTTFNYGGHSYSDDGSSVILQYKSTSSGLTYQGQVYYESKYPDSSPGDRIFTGITELNLDNDGRADYIVAVKYANEHQYFNWFEDDGSGGLVPVASSLGGTLADPKWAAYGIRSGRWTPGVAEYGGKAVVSELLVTAEYDPGSTNDSTYLFHNYVVDNGDGSYGILGHNNIALLKGVGQAVPAFTGVDVIGPSSDSAYPAGEGWYEIALAVNYVGENGYVSGFYWNPNFAGQQNITYGPTANMVAIGNILIDTNADRDLGDVLVVSVPEPSSMACVSVLLAIGVRCRRARVA